MATDEENLNDVINSGEKEVEYKDKRIEFQNVKDLMLVRDQVARKANKKGSSIRKYNNYSKGL